MRILVWAALGMATISTPAQAQDNGEVWAQPNSDITGVRQLSTAEIVGAALGNKDHFRLAARPDVERLNALVDAGDDQATYDYLVSLAREDKVWAMLELGAAFAKGTIVEQDAVSSLNWFAEAARRGNSQAALIMGVAYSAGDILVPDAEKARYWLDLAKQEGDFKVKRDATKYLASL